MKNKHILLAMAATAIAGQLSAQTLIDWGGNTVTATQGSQSSLVDIGGVPGAGDSIRQVGGFASPGNPAIGPDYSGGSFLGGAQAVKFGVNAENGLARAEVINDAGGDYISLFAQSPSGTTNSHLNFLAIWDAPVNYNQITGITGTTAGGVSGSLVSRFIVRTTGGGYYLSNTSISGGNGAAPWSVADLGAEQWAAFNPDTSGNWRGNFDSLSFTTSLAGMDLDQIGWFGARDSGVAGFTNSTLTIRAFSVTAVPEPSTFAILAGIGALGFVLYRRRRAS
jgi:hypothetical protein